MKTRLFNIFVLLAMLGTLAACGAVNQEPDSIAAEPLAPSVCQVTTVPAVQEKSFNDKMREWANVLGANPDSEETQQLLSELNQGGCCTRSEDLKVYLPFVLQKDITLFTSIDQLSLVNAELFHSYECLTREESNLRACETDPTKSFAELHVEKLISHYSALVEQTNYARERIISIMRILDFEIPPVAELSDSVKDAFSAAVNRAIVKAVASDDTAFQGRAVPQIDSALLQSVSLQLDDQAAPVSFFQFTITDLNGRRGRGVFELTPAEINPLILSVTITLAP